VPNKPNKKQINTLRDFFATEALLAVTEALPGSGVVDGAAQVGKGGELVALNGVPFGPPVVRVGALIRIGSNRHGLFF
jgi:hypothetical protein